MRAARIAGTIIGLAAGVMGAGCAKDGYWKPATSMPAGFGADNPCDRVSQSATRSWVPSARDGWVALKYHVASNGDVFNVRVIASSPEGVFDEAAAATVERWRYRPMRYALRNCSHVQVYERRDYADARRARGRR